MPPPSRKRRKIEPSVVVEEVTFDSTARQEYLTGFHKRKLQRTKAAQELAEKRARAERVEARKKLRDERKADLEKHVAEVNALLRPPTEEKGALSDSSSEWEGIEGISEPPPPIDHESEYIDEDKYTTVTVEEMDISKEGLLKANTATGDKSEDDEPSENPATEEKPEKSSKKTWSKDNPRDKAKKKKKKFRYESKAVRKFTRMKEHSKNSKQAKERRAK